MITSAALEDFAIALHHPLVTAKGIVTERAGFVLIVTDEHGHQGQGEIAPLPGWSSSTLKHARAEVCRWMDLTRAAGEPAPRDGLAPESQAGIDAALWGLRAHRAGSPLWQVINAAGQPEVEVNALLVGDTPAELAGAAQAAQAAGFTTLKAKVGTGDDNARLSALAALLAPQVLVRLDANCSWAVERAKEMSQVAAAVLGDQLEYIEDPVGSLNELEEFRSHSEVSVAVDELLGASADLERALSLTDVVVLKPPLLGGITDTLEVAASANEAGVDVVVSSLIDGPVGLTAWCHLAASLGSSRAHGLGTAALLDHPGAEVLLARDGSIRL